MLLLLMWYVDVWKYRVIDWCYYLVKNFNVFLVVLMVC